MRIPGVSIIRDMHDRVVAAVVMLHLTALCDVAPGETLAASSQ